MTNVHISYPPPEPLDGSPVKCIDKKLVIGAVVVVGGLLLLKPAWVVAALPLLLLAICPLSMMLMMGGMRGHSGHGAAQGSSSWGHKHPTAEESPLHKQIADLQEEVRILRAETVRRHAPTETPPPAVDFKKPDEPSPHS
jgi:Protein of unknown function (DUF2933)